MTEGALKRSGFSTIGGRKAKAEKITTILAAAGRPLNPTDDVLDLGCSSGETSTHLARLARISCADAIDQCPKGTELRFHPVGDTPPLYDQAFDVICNRVIEHFAGVLCPVPQSLLDASDSMQSTLILLLRAR